MTLWPRQHPPLHDWVKSHPDSDLARRMATAGPGEVIHFAWDGQGYVPDVTVEQQQARRH
jgi:hypothetical protein